MRPFRFGISLRQVGRRDEWIAKCRRAEELGYDVIAVADHLGPGRASPLTALAVAAAVTERPRVVPFVLNVPFYHAALLAREVATTSGLTDGRLDLGLGAGHSKAEFDDAGLPWWRAGERIAYLERVLGELRERLGEALPPVLIAGNSDGVLALAARHADCVGLAGLRQVRGAAPDTLTLTSARELDERVAYVHDRAGTRAADLEFNLLVQDVVVTNDPERELARWRAAAPDLDLGDAELLEAPQLLLGEPDELVARVRALRERYGVSYVTVFEPAMETFAPVVRELAGR
ncbi:TIGR03621 family F420-dependent LLM class oxidoreductase [Prauserella shujinwangii]|nr:TIGR03621 family F420-dependent LLM class oxidoreductase [Prauserella shujinwangii]